MKKSVIILWLLFGSATAADLIDTATVISVMPIHERVIETTRECATATVPVAPGHSVGGAVIGGVAGGLLGSQIGGGTGKKAATVAGVVAGAMAGDRIATRNDPRTRKEERCRDVETGREVTSGYQVIYRYNGQDVTTTLPYEPGATVRVRVNIIEDPR
ncbi:MAG: glycine zipper 2TM domain-containing protein [Gallionella sp.]